MREAISMQSACNQHAISMQSACNQHAITWAGRKMKLGGSATRGAAAPDEGSNER
jgi:hypothetical protein